ncbi:MAG: hypothetical protein M3081_07465 [Gemmatimonadota bacterium]|nr:hypothetical protein [Gemmatimonadota bacterium]
MHDTLRLYYVGYAIGSERYSLTSAATAQRLVTDSDYSDRGRRTHLEATMRMSRDFTPAQLEIARVTDSSTVVETRVEVEGRRATVARGQTTQVVLPNLAFTIATHAPVTQHLMLVRYWLAHGRPPRPLRRCRRGRCVWMATWAL